MHIDPPEELDGNVDFPKAHVATNPPPNRDPIPITNVIAPNVLKEEGEVVPKDVQSAFHLTINSQV